MIEEDPRVKTYPSSLRRDGWFDHEPTYLASVGAAREISYGGCDNPSQFRIILSNMGTDSNYRVASV